jgi:hypothetical protein
MCVWAEVVNRRRVGEWGARSCCDEGGQPPSCERKMGKGRDTDGRDPREKPREETEQSPADTRILHWASSESQNKCEVMHLISNQSRTCTDEGRQGRFD